MKVKIKKLSEKATIPKRESELAGGWDVTATDIIQEESDFVICKLGFALTPPPGYKVTIVPRSSLTKTRWVIQNSPCLGDEDYRGEYQIRFRAIPSFLSSLYIKFGYDKFPFSAGDRIAQMYLEEVIPIEFEEVDELDETIRSDGSFGSTG